MVARYKDVRRALADGAMFQRHHMNHKEMGYEMAAQANEKWGQG